jgi:tRNA pseudouridine55 synthase
LRTSSRRRGLAPDEGAHGLLLIDKPSGITSHDAIDLVRRATSTRKVGHAGTLDPPATGLLLVGVGKATRLLRFLGELPKLYEGTGILGVETDTLDATGNVVREAPVKATEAELRAAMAALTGQIEQVPPAYSAVKVEGRPLYRAARKGQQVHAPPRRVHVYAFNLRRFQSPRFEFRVRCSGGTYVRTLVADVGGSLGCGAHLSALRRTGIGPFDVRDAHPPGAPGPLLPPESAVEHLSAVMLEEEEARAASHGRVLAPTGILGPYRVLTPDRRLIGIYRDEGAKAVPEVILQ